MKPLSLYETRIIGCLIEKSLTTPDQYPLSLNALTNACNQKSNREPVLDLTEAQVQEVTDGLVEAGLVTSVSGWGSRVAKYQHRFCNTEFSELKLTPQEVAILCILFVRGPQTSSELRTRTQRLCAFNDVLDVEKTLHKMMTRSEGALLEKLGRYPGQREARYAHLLGDGEVLTKAPIANQTQAAGSAAEFPPSESERLNGLELRLDRLEKSLRELHELVDDLLK